MRCKLLRLFKLLSTALSIGWFAAGHAQPRSTPSPAVCSEVTTLGSAPISVLPRSIQEQIRQAVKPAVLAVLNDPGMGLVDSQWNDILLDALKITQLAEGEGLYVVSWADRSFGANELIWIVEVGKADARNLLDSRISPSSRPTVTGFGVEVLSKATEQYPEIMIASKGFALGGGAEAAATCLHKVGDFYEPLPCPADCHRNLNSR